MLLKLFVLFAVLSILRVDFISETHALQLNKTVHHLRREKPDVGYFKNQNAPAYRSFQPLSIKYHKVYPVNEERPYYDMTSYDTEYGGVVSNFTSSVYDENPPLYPNPELITSGNEQVNNKLSGDILIPESDVDLPDDSLADADLKEHNVIDSVTYLYGFNTCHGMRTEWLVLIFIGGFISVVLVGVTVLWLLWSNYAKEFRTHSLLYPISINLCCCLEACTFIYLQAILGVSTPSHCEKIALLLHYTYLVCSIWIILMAASITEYSQSGTVMSLKFNYLIAYGVPAIYVMFNYAVSLEQYEIKHYCWMSIEKGMVLGFMAPAMVLILMNTALIIMGLQSVNEKQGQLLAAKIQELVDHHISNWPKTEAIEELDKEGSTDTLDNMFTPCSSRKNTDSSDTLEKDYNYDDDCHYVSMGMGSGGDERCSDASNECNPDSSKPINDKGLLSMFYMDNLSWRSTWNMEGNELKAYLNLCLVLEPFFAVNWVMGVVAIENASHWSTPTIYVIILTCMHGYLAATLSMTLPILRPKEAEPCCENVVTEPTLTRSRTTDSIPLLDPTVQQPIATPAPADTISTISI